MAKLQINGRIYIKGETVGIPSRNGNTFYKRELVLDASHYDPYTGQKYENYPKFEFTGNKLSELDKFNVGDMVTVSFFLSGRAAEKNGQTSYFTSVVGYAIDAFQPPRQGYQAPTAVAPVQQVEQVPQQIESPAPFPPHVDENGNPDDLPF